MLKKHCSAALWLTSGIWRWNLDGERLVLRGIVGSFFHKQLAQELLRNAVEDLEIANAISVEYRACDDAPDWLAE